MEIGNKTYGSPENYTSAFQTDYIAALYLKTRELIRKLVILKKLLRNISLSFDDTIDFPVWTFVTSVLGFKVRVIILVSVFAACARRTT